MNDNLSNSNTGGMRGKVQVMKIHLSTLMGEVREGRLSSLELMLRESFSISPIDGNPKHSSFRCWSCSKHIKAIAVLIGFVFIQTNFSLSNIYF